MNQDHFPESDYTGVTFEHIHFDSGTLATKEFSRCTFLKCTFRQSTFSHVTMTDCLFKNCDLSVLKVPNSRLMNVRFVSSKVTGVNWTQVARTNSVTWLTKLFFDDTDISYANYTELPLEGIVVTNGRAFETDFTEANLTNGIFTGTDFTGARFWHTNLTKANFVGAVNYGIDVTVNSVKQMKVTLPDGLSLLSGMGIIVE